MTISQTQCTSFKVELAQGIHNFTATTGDVFKIALFRNTDAITGTYGPATTNYSNMGADEVSGTGYTAGGATLTNITPVADGTTCVFSFSDVQWLNSTLTSCGALIYNSSKANRAVCVISFGADKRSSNTPFRITFPTATSTTAILRVE